MVSVTTTGFGADAIETTSRLLSRRRGGDPLAPAVVLCPGPLAAVALRRALGRRPGGVAAVSVVTADELATDLAAPAMTEAGRRPATDLEVQAALRAELQERPGLFDRVADHHTTEDRLVGLHHQVAGLDDEHLARLEQAGGGIAGDAFRVLRGAGRRMDRVWDRSQVLAVARDELARLPEGALGPIVLHLPEPTTPFEGLLVAALVRRADCEVVVGLTGDAGIDRRHLERLAGWGIQLERPVPAEVATARVLEVADPDDEVRTALNDISAHAAAGVPLSSMAVLYPHADPYATLLAERLDAAGIPWSGPGHRPLASSLAGRFLLRLLGLLAEGLDRASVMALLATGPVLDAEGSLVPVYEWDGLSRQAGVIDPEHWTPRLESLARHYELSSVPEIGPEGKVVPPEADGSRRLLRFVTGLDAALAQGARTRTWAAWAEWVSGMLATHLRPDGDWPAAERAALTRIRSLLDRLGDLDHYGSGVDAETCATVFASRLERLTMPGPAHGSGLLVAPVAEAPALAFERAVIVGLAEGTFPRVVRDDALLPNRLRAGTAGLVAGTDTLTDVDIRAVAAAVAAANRSALLVTARGDLRGRRSRHWPRALDPVVAERTVVESHHRVLADQGRPLSTEELGLRALVNHVGGGDPVHTHDLASRDRVLANALTRADARRRGELNRFVGLVRGDEVDLADRLLSATALEDYAACPRRYLLGRVLRLGEDEQPERIEEITPMDRGTLVHAILERFIASAVADGSVPAPGRPWPPESRARLFEILETLVDQAQRRGITGGRVATLILRRRLAAEMAIFLRTDDALRADRGSTPVRAELGFGMDDEPSEVVLPDGRTLRLRGFVDRVDATADGGVLVIDYKGGSPRAFDGLAADPLDGGRRLQLPLYAKVVAERLGREGPRTALYWLTRNGDLRPVELEETLETDLHRTVAAALDGISGGLFPAVPGEAVGWPRLTYANCRYCDFDRLCPTDRQREWDGVRGDRNLIPLQPLVQEFDR